MVTRPFAKILFGLIVALHGWTPLAFGKDFPQLKKDIQAALPLAKMNDLRVGMVAVSLTKGDTIFEYRGDSQMIPASVNKIFTAYVALKRLGATRTFDTEVYRTGILANGILAGNLYLKGGGDPSLVSERMWMLTNELVRSGIRTIQGNLVADSTYFDANRTPASRPNYLKDQAYNAPVGALSFNFNTTTIFVKPGEKPGAAPVVYTDPENSYIEVVNQATTAAAEAANTLKVKRTSFVQGDIGDTVLLRGAIPMGHRELRFYRNIVNPSLYTAHMFRTFWERRGLTLKGHVQEGEVPKRSKKVLTFESQPLWQVIWGMNKFSNNFVADQILKKVGAEVIGSPGSLDKGTRALASTLSKIGIPKGTYTITDGSGLTRKTKVTARQVVRVLQAAHNDFSMSGEFMASLGVAGTDGTLRSRLHQLSTRLRAKTGSLDGVSSLAGFMEAKNGELIAFAILLNDPRIKYGKLSRWVDKLTLALSTFNRK